MTEISEPIVISTALAFLYVIVVLVLNAFVTQARIRDAFVNSVAQPQPCSSSASPGGPSGMLSWRPTALVGMAASKGSSACYTYPDASGVCPVGATSSSVAFDGPDMHEAGPTKKCIVSSSS